MYKVVAGVVLGFALAGANVAQADSDLGEQLTECKEQLATIYGEDVRVRISGRSEVGDAVLNLRVYPKGERLLRVSCKRSADGGLNMMDRYGMALVLPEQEQDILGAL